MMNAYDRTYLDRARTSMGRMLDYAVYDLKIDFMIFWDMFLSSNVSSDIERGDASVLAGKSGVEMALLVTGLEKDYVKPVFQEEKSKEYWTGWALAYFQWMTGLSFSQITEQVPMNEVRAMYSPYHEMDIRQFCDRMLELYKARKKLTNVKKLRLNRGLTQAQLAVQSGIPLRTIQQYEQGQKDINKARAEYLIYLSKALYCEPAQLLECDYITKNEV